MEKYLNTLLEQIRCKKARSYIRQELQDHMEDQIEANIHAGMDYESAEKAAVKDMGDPVETGISFDRIHRPQIAWKLLLIIILITASGILIHRMISGQFEGSDTLTSDKYIIHVMIGITVMMVFYFLDYTLLAKFSKLIAFILIVICCLTLAFGVNVNGALYYISIGNKLVSIQTLMLFYVPIYGGILYKYHGLGYVGLVKAIAWMIIPVVLVLKLPATMTADLMLISMLVMLTKAIKQGWFVVHKKKAIGGLWGIFMIMPVLAVCTMYFGNYLPLYQKARIRACFSTGGDTNYVTTVLRSALTANQFVGNSGTDLKEILPAFNSDFLLAYLSSAYGNIMRILIFCIMAVLIVSVFGTAIRQKNQVGMMMGCGCGMIFLVSFLVNVLVNLGALPQTATFLPFLSAGGSEIIVSYGLMGIVLSIYRYKNIHPRHVNINIYHKKITTEL